MNQEGVKRELLVTRTPIGAKANILPYMALTTATEGHDYYFYFQLAVSTKMDEPSSPFLGYC
jgi:hypothetical protein